MENNSKIKNFNPIITVSVTAYKRAQMIEDLIKSYLLQSYNNSELLIIDDCVEDNSVEKLVKHYQSIDNRIRFIKNQVNLGYYKNFLKSLTEVKGKYIITLGDDDIFLDENAIETYVKIFENYPQVGYIHTNTIQFNENYEMDYVYKSFEKDTLYATPEESLKKIWLKSIHIAGIGLRNGSRLKEFYPKEHLLFPQVELIGKLFGKYQSFGIAKYLIGVRAHSAQLGFYAAKGQRIKKKEKFGPIEMYQIFDTMLDFYKKDPEINFNEKITNMNGPLIRFFSTILPSIKINSGNMALIKSFSESFRVKTPLFINIRFIMYFIIALCFPKKILFILKEWRKKIIKNKKFNIENDYFINFVSKARIKDPLNY